MSKKDFEIQTTIRAKNKATRSIGNVQKSLISMSSKGSMAVRGLNRHLQSAQRTLTSGIKAGATVAAAGITAVAGAVWKLSKEFSRIEDSEAAFTPVLGGAAKAKAMVAALNETAATTPFQFENLSDATKQLLPNMNGDIGKTIETLRMLGDTAGGNAQKLDSIVRGYNKALLKGKVDMESLNMIAEAGVPIFKDLGYVMNLGPEKMFKTISKGKVEPAVLTAAFKRMTSKGGMFFKGMKIASETLTGQVSTLKDNFSLTAAELGEVLAPHLKDGVALLLDMTKQSRAWIKGNKALIGTKVAEYVKKIPDYLQKIAYWAPRIGIVVAGFYALSTAVRVVNVAMTAFNLLTNINLGPIKAMGSLMSKQLPLQIGASTAAMTALQVAMVAGVGVAAVGLGYLLYKSLVEPLQKARHEAAMLRAEHDDTMKKDLSKRNSAMLKGDIQNADKAIKSAKSSGVLIPMAYAPAGFDPMAAFRKEEISGLASDRKSLQNALAYRQQSENIQRYDRPGMSVQGEDWAMPRRSEMSTRETVEVTIKDETGRAKVTKGKSRHLKLARTGGLP